MRPFPCPPSVALVSFCAPFCLVRELAERGKNVIVAAHGVNAALPCAGRRCAIRIGGQIAGVLEALYDMQRSVP